MTDDTLIESKQADGFKTESPICAFTDFQIAGSYAIGKGFRPSLGHLSRYLDAMLAKEGWAVLQIILPRDSDGDPTILFEKGLPSFDDLGIPEAIYSVRGKCDWQMVNDFLTEQGVSLVTDGLTARLLSAAIPDPTNPPYYDGKACAEIIEYMPFNVGVAGKYCWRLGEKDPEEQECGKAVWYLEREIVLHTQTIAPRPTFGLAYVPPPPGIPPHAPPHWFRHMAQQRIDARDMPMWRKRVMVDLVCYTTTGHLDCLRSAIEAFDGTKRVGEPPVGTGLAI